MKRELIIKAGLILATGATVSTCGSSALDATRQTSSNDTQNRKTWVDPTFTPPADLLNPLPGHHAIQNGACIIYPSQETAKATKPQFECKANDGNEYLVPQLPGLTQKRVFVGDGVFYVKYIADKNNPYGFQEGQDVGVYDPNVFTSDKDGNKIHTGGLALVSNVVDNFKQNQPDSVPIPLDISTYKSDKTLGNETTISQSINDAGVTKTVIRTTRLDTVVTRPEDGSVTYSTDNMSATFYLNGRRDGIKITAETPIPLDGSIGMNPTKVNATHEGDEITEVGGYAIDNRGAGAISLTKIGPNGVETAVQLLTYSNIPVFLIQTN